MASSLRARVNFQRTPNITLDKIVINNRTEFEIRLQKDTIHLIGSMENETWSKFKFREGFYRRRPSEAAPRLIEFCLPAKCLAFVTLRDGQLAVYEESIYTMLLGLSSKVIRPYIAELLVQKLAEYESTEAGSAMAIKEHALKKSDLADRRAEIDFVFGCVEHGLRAKDARLIDTAFARSQVQNGVFGSGGLKAVKEEMAVLL